MAAIDDLSVLVNVIAAARAELSDRDPDDIPHKLTRAAAATGRRLPPPHRRAILAYIEGESGFRQDVRVRFIEAGFDDPLGLQYLTDPVSAGPMIELSVSRDALARMEVELEASLRRADKVEAKLTDSRARLKSAQHESSRKLAAKAEADKRARAGLEKAAVEAAKRAEHAAARAATLSAEAKVRDGEIVDLEARIVKLNEKRSKRMTDKLVRVDAARSAWVSDPIGIARDLDEHERRLRTFREVHREPGSPDKGRRDLFVPNGLSPSDAAALDAVVAQAPERVIVDGYNVSGLVNPGEFSTRDARDDVVKRASKLVRETDAAVVVVFDARQGSEGSTSFTSPIGVELVFEGDTTADDAIVAMVHADSDRCIVITNDREIHNRVRRDNCVAIFSTAFVSWSEHLNRS